MTSVAWTAGSPALVLGGGEAVPLALPEWSRRALRVARRRWAGALGQARRRYRVWRLEREVAHLVGVIGRLDDRQLGLLGLDRATMLDVIEERLVAREFGPDADRLLILPAAR
jgi:hypothetical protein